MVALLPMKLLETLKNLLKENKQIASQKGWRMAEKTGKPQRKVKGKNWYVVLAPALFRERELFEIPATDPKYLKGRKMEVGLGELTGDYKKFARFPAIIKLKILEVDGNRAKTVFSGYEVSKDFIFRATRKRTQKVELTEEYETEDGWSIQVTGLIILNRNVYASIEKKVRNLFDERLREMVSKNSMNDVLKDLLNRITMSKVRKETNKIYPARVAEITKIEILSRPE
jgi:ribosomal protein S3AE